MSRWSFVLTELDGTQIGGVSDATDRSLKLSLNGLSAASFTIRLDNPMADEIMTHRDVMLKVYQDSTLRFNGDLVSAEEVGQDDKQTLACNFGGPLWRLQKRLYGKGASGLSFTYVVRGGIAQSVLTTLNTERDTGIRIGTNSTTALTTTGLLHYKPVAELLTDMATAKAIAYDCNDGFDQVAGWLTGKQLFIPSDATGIWAGAGSTADFAVDDVNHVAYRVTPGADVYPNGRFAIAGTQTFTDVTAQVDFKWGSQSSAISGLILRYTDINNWLIMRVATSASQVFYRITKRVAGGTPVDIASSTVGGWYAQDVWFRLVSQVDEDGNYWYYLTFRDGGIATGPQFTGTDTDLATGGPLASGKVGFYDCCETLGAAVRVYDNFSAQAPPGVEGFDFEFVPTEHTADTDESGVVGAGVQIATMNIYDVLGQSKPNAVFEYGTGSRSVRSYRRVFSREGLLNQAYCLPAGSEPTDSNIMYAQDLASIATRGIFEEVLPSEFDDEGMRRALCTEHVRVRSAGRELITFDPSVNAPTYGTDYVVGDLVTARGKYNGEERFNGEFRVYGVEISIDDEGKETAAPTVTPE